MFFSFSSLAPIRKSLESQKKQSNEDGKQVECQISAPEMSAAAKMSMGLTGGRDGVRRDEWINTRGDEGMGGGFFIRVMFRGASGSKRGRMLWFIQSGVGAGGRGQGVCCPQHQASM